MFNQITIMGRLAKEPDMRRTRDDVTVTSFTVAVERDFGEKATDFIDCVAWRHTAEFVEEYFHKGDQILVTGRLQSRKWEDKECHKRTSWEINVNGVYFAQTAPTKETFEELDDEGEIPF